MNEPPFFLYPIAFGQYYAGPAGRAVSQGPADLAACDTVAALAALVAPGELVAAADSRPVARFLPGLWGVASLQPHWNPVWLDELKAWQASRRPSVYVASGTARPDTLEHLRPGGADWRPRTVAAAGDTVTLWLATPRSP